MPMQENIEPSSAILRGGRVLLSSDDVPQTCDIVIDRHGTIASIAPHISPPAGVSVVDLQGFLVSPGLIDMHQHLDKTRTRDAVHAPDGSLSAAISAYNQYAKTRTIYDIMRCAEATVDACIKRGTVGIRTHVNVGPDFGLRGLEAISALSAKLNDRISLQIVALPPPDPDAAAQWIEDAVAVGIHAIGGVPAHAKDPMAFLATIFAAAEHHGLGIDLHLDEHLNPERHLFDAIIEMTVAQGMQERVVAGHCSALSALPERTARRLIDGFAKAGIGVVTLPAANLHLLGRTADVLCPRGLTRVRDLQRAGVAIACASDNIQDPFVPTGSGDMLEIARWTMLAGHYDPADFSDVFAMITSSPAVMTEGSASMTAGSPANFLITDAIGTKDLIASGPLERTVFFRGKVVAGALPNKACMS